MKNPYFTQSGWRNRGRPRVLDRGHRDTTTIDIAFCRRQLDFAQRGGRRGRSSRSSLKSGGEWFGSLWGAPDVVDSGHDEADPISAITQPLPHGSISPDRQVLRRDDGSQRGVRRPLPAVADVRAVRIVMSRNTGTPRTLPHAFWFRPGCRRRWADGREVRVSVGAATGLPAK
jgi:hypothetical protein